MGAADRPGACFRETEMPDLAFSDQCLDRAGDILDRSIGVDAVLVEEIDDIGLQTLQRLVGHGAYLLRAAVHAALAAIGIEVETEFRGDHHLLAKGGEGLSQKLFVLMGAVGLGRVEEGHAAFERPPDQCGRFLNICRRAITVTQPHAAETDGRDLKSALSKFTLLHRCFLF